MKRFIIVGLSLVFLAFLGCSGENSYPTSTNEDGIALAKKGPKEPKPPKGPALGACPNIYYESSKTLSNGAIVTWSSSFNGFDYTTEDDYTVTVTWSVANGSATFHSFKSKKKTWTPKGVDGTWSFAGNTLTVSINPMHRAIDPGWKGYIGNGHFKLDLDVDGVKAKLGVNVHLEDPDAGYDDRCP